MQTQENENSDNLHAQFVPQSPLDSLEIRPFTDLTRGPLKIPSGWMRQNVQCGEITLIHIYLQKCIRTPALFKILNLKEVLVKPDMSLQINISGHTLDPIRSDLKSMVSSREELEDFLITVDRLNVCQGFLVPEMQSANCNFICEDERKFLHSVKCAWLLSDSKICQFCSGARKKVATILRNQKNSMRAQRISLTLSPKKRKQIVKMQTKYKSAIRAKKRAASRIEKLKSELKECQTKMAEYCEDTLNEHLKSGSISKNQFYAMKEIMAAAKHSNSKGRRYCDEWVLLCILLCMRSPSSYEFMRTNEILPLPCERTIRRYTSSMTPTCGFDPKFFNLLKVALAKKSEEERHGILLIDEISTRESISVDTQTLSYRGLVDFGSDREQPQSLTEKANHGLVVMFQPLFGTYTQPIAVFASRGPVKGEVIAQLIVKAIVLMENIGAKIHGVISDGAGTNRKFWKEMGVSAERKNLRNYFEHPSIKGRKIFVFSDTPHLIKTIRNRLYNNGVLQIDPAEPCIKWEHFRILHEKDKEFSGPGKLLMCPKLSVNHLDLNNSLKMRVRLAVQVFSNSVAKGLRLFEKYVPELKDCGSTASFCQWINDLFDALNRKDSNKGVVPGNPDYQLIEDALKKLDRWEENVENGKISNNLFLTKQTAEGLRVTLQSTLDLTQYLITHCGFPYVLTGRLNQDALEKFFGTVRQAGGCNDHPSTPTFLCIYKILSVYRVLKPPKLGNCTVNEKKPPESLITLADLKSIHENSDNIDLSQTIRERLEKIIQWDPWSFEDFIDQDYNKPEVIDCIMYYMTAELTKRITQTIKCLACKDALIGSGEHAIIRPEAAVLTEYYKDSLVHPSTQLYRLILFLEGLFTKHCNSEHVSESILDEIYNSDRLSFPCTLHATEVIFHIIHYFVRIRMQQYTTRLNLETKKNNQ